MILNRLTNNKKIIVLQEFSVPLIAGVIIAVFLANVDHSLYSHLVHTPLKDIFNFDPANALDHSQKSGHHGNFLDLLSLHFIINDFLMVFFFGIAAKEITESVLPGSSLHPFKKAINPICGTIGGVIGPVVTFFLLLKFMMPNGQNWHQGWGIPIATDIALAWLIAKIVFGARHPAISYLLLLAIIDDAIGLIVIAVAYPDPNNPTLWINLLWILPAMTIAFTFRKLKIKSWIPYILFGGSLSWYGLFTAHLHPALALLPIVPFLPGPKRDIGIFVEEKVNNNEDYSKTHTTLENFEHDLKLIVDFGLFFFAFANAGVEFSVLNKLSWLIFISLIVGKTIGIYIFSYLAIKIGFPLPKGMGKKHLLIVGIISGLGLTVALFIAHQAFPNKLNQDAAKMGALLSIASAFIAYYVAKIIKVNQK